MSERGHLRDVVEGERQRMRQDEEHCLLSAIA
jgi:hypothetical protein